MKRFNGHSHTCSKYTRPSSYFFSVLVCKAELRTECRLFASVFKCQTSSLHSSLFQSSPCNFQLFSCLSAAFSAVGFGTHAHIHTHIYTRTQTPCLKASTGCPVFGWPDRKDCSELNMPWVVQMSLPINKHRLQPMSCRSRTSSLLLCVCLCT